MSEYIEMWKRYADFGGCTTVRGYWMAFLFNAIIGYVLGFVLGLIGLGFLSYIYTLAALIPGLAITVRRLRDGGCHWANIFWPALPLVGTIILIIKLCKKSV